MHELSADRKYLGLNWRITSHDFIRCTEISKKFDKETPILIFNKCYYLYPILHIKYLIRNHFGIDMQYIFYKYRDIFSYKRQKPKFYSFTETLFLFLNKNMAKNLFCIITPMVFPLKLYLNTFFVKKVYNQFFRMLFYASYCKCIYECIFEYILISFEKHHIFCRPLYNDH